MIFYSTRNKEDKATYGQAIFKGLAEDGGLYHPETMPDLREIFDNFDKTTSFLEIAEKTTYALLSDEISQEQAHQICHRAFKFKPELKKLSSKISILELFHGPSAAFKDFGASFLASSMETYLADKNERAVILTATSGDTGSAVARAFYKKDNIDVIILYPSGRVSPLQEKSLTTLGENIHALEVNGTFDDCQRVVKEAFQDLNLKKEYSLSSANSINIGRLIPQSFYYIWAWAQQKSNPDDKVNNLTFCVPSGNFGNLTAGILASKWGMNVNKFIAATNANNVIPKFLETGEYKAIPSIATYSNAMDVGDPSNFERLKEIYKDNKEMSAEVEGVFVDDQTTLKVMEDVYNRKDYFVCPHTAVGYEASSRFLEKNPEAKIISLATAHPAKFLEVTDEALGVIPPIPQRLKSLLKKDKIAEKINPTLEDLKFFLVKNF
ncbi:MAG: threonine synthase [Spirochaetales bacterium]|nr:threonine synthase [Spirochaetales bacterium]